MDKFEIFDRGKNEWVNYELIVGWTENFKQDKSTDTGKVKCKIDGLNFPKIERGDWCRFLHLNDNETGATYIQKTGTRRISGLLVDVFNIENYDELTHKFTLKTNKAFTKNINFRCKAVFGNTEQDSTILTLTAGQTTIDVQFSQSSEEYKKGSFQIYTAGFEQEVNENSKVSYTFEESFVYYIPKNNTQFIIGNVSMVSDKINNQIDIQLDLLEPIEIMNGIVCETRSFTNQISKQVVENEQTRTYIHEPKTFLNVLESILRITPLNNDYQNSWLSRFKIANSSHLANKQFNDDTFSEPTLYGILLDKYDNLLGRTPIIYFDINGENDKPFTQERTEYVLDFLRQDGFDKEDIQLEDLKNGNSQIIINKSWENKADGIVCNFDNFSPDKTSKFVSEYLWAIPEVNSDERTINTHTSEDDLVWIIKTPQSIKNIKKILRLENSYYQLQPTAGRYVTHYDRIIQDETIKTFEKKVYETQSDTQKKDCIWFEEGTNIIHLNGFHYDENKIYVYQVEYEPLIAGRYDISGNYSVIVNQTDGQISGERLSTYLQQYLNSMNKSDLIIQKTVDKYSDICELGSRVIDNDKIYLITNISIVNRNDIYDVIYQLNENHFRKTDNISAPQEIRKNTSIGYNGLTDRKSCFLINYGLSVKNVVQQDKKNWIDKKSMFSSLLKNNTGTMKPQLAYLTFKSALKDNENNEHLKTINLLCDGSRSVLNNTFCFNLRYINNAEAGKYKILHQRTGAYPLLTSPETQEPILYTNIFGEQESLDVKLIEFEIEQISQVEMNTDKDNPSDIFNEIVKGNRYLRKTSNYPLITGFEFQEQNIIASINNIEYLKDMLDIFNLTIGIKINTDNNIILCQSFFNDSCFIGDFVGISKVSVNNNNLSEDDCQFVGGIDIQSSVINDNSIVLSWNEELPNGKSLVLWDINNKPILILNDLEKVDNIHYTKTKLILDC